MLPVCRRGSQPAAQVGLQLLGVTQPEVHTEPGLLRAQPTDCVSLAKLFAPPADQLVRPRALLLLWRPARQAAPGLLRGTLRSEIKNVNKDLDIEGCVCTSSRAVWSLVCQRVACSHTASHCPFTDASRLSIASALEGLAACSAKWEPTTLMLIATLLWLSNCNRMLLSTLC